MDPRIERTRQKALDAARRILLTEGIGAVTHLRIAESGGAGRRTLYRHWPDQTSLLLDVLAVQDVKPAARTGNLHVDLVAHLTAFSAALSRGHLAQIICAIGERSATHPEFEPLRKQITEQGCEPLRAILRAAIKDGRLPPSLDERSALAALEGPVLYESVMHRRRTTSRAIDELVERFLAQPPLK